MCCTIFARKNIRNFQKIVIVRKLEDSLWKKKSFPAAIMRNHSLSVSHPFLIYFERSCCFPRELKPNLLQNANCEFATFIHEDELSCEVCACPVAEIRVVLSDFAIDLMKRSSERRRAHIGEDARP